MNKPTPHTVCIQDRIRARLAICPHMTSEKCACTAASSSLFPPAQYPAIKIIQHLHISVSKFLQYLYTCDHISCQLSGSFPSHAAILIHEAHHKLKPHNSQNLPLCNWHWAKYCYNCWSNSTSDWPCVPAKLRESVMRLTHSMWSIQV